MMTGGLEVQLQDAILTMALDGCEQTWSLVPHNKNS
jgi:hypothetical protein